MPIYHVNKNAQPSGEHEVHVNGCSHQPSYSNQTDLGYHSDCKAAVDKAKTLYSNSDGCAYCCPECHKK